MLYIPTQTTWTGDQLHAGCRRLKSCPKHQTRVNKEILSPHGGERQNCRSSFSTKASHKYENSMQSCHSQITMHCITNMSCTFLLQLFPSEKQEKFNSLISNILNQHKNPTKIVLPVLVYHSHVCNEFFWCGLNLSFGKGNACCFSFPHYQVPSLVHCIASWIFLVAKGKQYSLRRERLAEALLSAGVSFQMPTELHCKPHPQELKDVCLKNLRITWIT